MTMPLVLLPGLLSNEALWKHQIQHLGDIAETYVISSTENTPQKMVQAILDQAPPQFALAGHSMGGWLCLEVMRRAPERVTQLCLINTTARADSEEKRSKRKKMVLQTERGDFKEVVKDLVAHLVLNPLAKKEVENMFLGTGEDIFINQEKSMLMRDECQSVLPTISCPTLVIHSQEDKNFSFDEHRELVDQIQGAKLAVIEDSGHMSPMEMPQVITTLLRFWLTYLK